MPGSIALGRSALPLRFAEWLQKEINARLGVNYSIVKTETAGYDGYGLKFNPETNTGSQSLTPQQKQQAQQLYSQYLESLNKPNTNPILQGNQKNIEEIITQLEKEGLLEIDCKGKLKAEKGLATSFVKGGKWKVIKDLKGYPTHKEGGVDLTIGKGGVSIKNGNTQFTAKHGLVIPKAQDGLVISNNPEYEAMSKVLSQRNKSLNWVERGLNPNNYPTIDNGDGTFSTHRLEYKTGDNGEAYVYPTIIQNDKGELEQLDDDAAWDYAMKTKTAMVVPNVKLAEYYSQNGLIKH